MIRFFETRAGLNSPLWQEARWLWKGDRLRRKSLRQLNDLRFALHLGQCRLWLAWDDDPPKELNWMKPLHVIGMVVTMTSGDLLTIQFAAGQRIQSWMPMAVERLAREENCGRIQVFVRVGWKQEMPPAWRPYVRTDPELLYVSPNAIAA